MTTPHDRRLAADELQAELRDLLCLAVAGDHVRWVITGDDAGELGDWLTEAVPQWRAMAADVARHMVTLGVAPDGRVRSLAKDIPLNWVPDGWLRPDQARRLVEHRLHGALRRAQHRRSRAAGAETVRLFAGLCASLEAQARERSEVGASAYSVNA